MAKKSEPIEGYRKHSTRDAGAKKGSKRAKAREAIALRDKAENQNPPRYRSNGPN